MTDPQQPSTPQDPTPQDPTPQDPTPQDPTPQDPTPQDPTPVDPTPVDPTPTPADRREPVDSFAAEPPADPPADPSPEVPTPVEPDPTVEPSQPEPTLPAAAAEAPAVHDAGEAATLPAAPAPPETPEPAASTAPEPPAPLAPPKPDVPMPEDATDDPGDDATGDTADDTGADTADLPPQAAAGVDASPDPTDGAVPAPAARRRSRSWLPVTAVGLAVALLAGATGLLAWQLRQQSLAEDARPDVIAAARDAARLLFSYDHKTLADDFAKGLAVTTGEFREEYSRTTAEVVTPVAEQYDAVVVAEVVEAAVIEAGAGKATALVFLNQGTTSTRVEGQQVDQSRVRMHLVERDGAWLVEAVEAL